MYNMKRLGGSFKGLIGECMFKSTRKNVVLPSFFSFYRWQVTFSKYLSPPQLDFVKRYWFSIDAIEISFDCGKRIILYEVKTKNVYKKDLGYRPKMTKATEDLYMLAGSLGFDIRIALVHLFNDWDFDISICAFDRKNYCLDRPKLYDRGYF